MDLLVDFLSGGEAGLGKEGLWQTDHPPGTCALEHDTFVIIRSGFLESCISIILVAQGRWTEIRRMSLRHQLLEQFSLVFYSNI